VVPKDRLYPIRQLHRGNLLEGRRRRGDQRLVVDEADRLDRHRIAPGLAVEAHRVPGEVEDAVLDLGRRLDRRDETRRGPFAEAVVRPDEDVRTVAGAGRLLELVRNRFRMLHDDLDAQLLGELVADGLQAVVALVAVDPDEELAVLEGRAQRGRGQEGRGRKAE